MYADGTPLKVKIAFDDGQTHEYKTASWHKLRVVPGTAYQPPEPQAPSGVSEEEIAPGLVVGARVEHVKHGHGTIQYIDLEAKHTKVKVAFDTGETHEYKGGSLDKLRVMQAAEIQAAEHDSSVVVALADRAVLLESKAHWKVESAFYKPTKLQLLAATGHDGTPDADAGAPPWSIIVVNGKAVPYEEVTAVKVDEKILEFIVEHTRKYSSRSTERLHRQHLRMYTRSEFCQWRDALRPEMIKPGNRNVVSTSPDLTPGGESGASASTGYRPGGKRAASTSTTLANVVGCWEAVLANQQASPPNSSDAHSQPVGSMIRRTQQMSRCSRGRNG